MVRCIDYENISVHKNMISDSIRTQSFRDAIMETVGRDSVVLDLGAGTGILTFFSCMAGARKVYSVERSSIINVARKIAKENEMDQRIIFIEDDIRAVECIEKVDIIVSECIGYFVLQENMFDAIIDSRNRFLKKDGSIIPSKIRMYLAPFDSVNSLKKYRFSEEIEFWNDSLYSINFNSVKKAAASSVYLEMVIPEDLLAESQLIRTIDMKRIARVSMKREIFFDIRRDGLISGLVGFFDVKLSENVSFSTSPAAPKTHWLNKIFPVYEPLPVRKGDIYKVIFKAIAGEELVDWEWSIKDVDTDKTLRKQRTSLGCVDKRLNVLENSLSGD